MKPIPYGRQEITQDDIDQVVDSLKSDYLTQGPKILEFEKAFAKYTGSKYAIAVSNGTAALHLSVMALGIKPGTKVLTTPITFAASANCVRYCGGEVSFVDISPESYLLDIEALRKKIELAAPGEYSGIIPVDFAGRRCDLEAIYSLAREFGLWVISDSCHSPGGYFIDSNGVKQFSGNGAFCDLSIFSFHPVKHIATGEGGMITTNDETLYQQILTLRTHGITRDSNLFVNSVDFASGQIANGDKYPGWYMEMQSLGYNYRITDIQAALGISQLSRANEGLRKRIDIAKFYNQKFQECDFIISQSGVVEGHAYHLYVIEVKDRFNLYNFLRSKNIFTQVHYIPVHLMPYYRELGWKEGDMPKAESYYKSCLSLPMFPSITDNELDYVVNSIFEYFR